MFNSAYSYETGGRGAIARDSREKKRKLDLWASWEAKERNQSIGCFRNLFLIRFAKSLENYTTHEFYV